MTEDETRRAVAIAIEDAGTEAPMIEPGEPLLVARRRVHDKMAGAAIAMLKALGWREPERADNEKRAVALDA